MDIKYNKIHSEILRQDFEFKVYGHSGKPVLVFPTSCGRFFDYEDKGMLEPLTPFIERGDIRLVCVDGRDWESWYKPQKDEWIAIRNSHYESCICRDVIPFLQKEYGINERYISTGNSMGAFHAVNFALKVPELFDGTIALSGVYNFVSELQGFYEPGLYFHIPLYYLPKLDDAKILAQLRESYFIVAHGTGAWETFNEQARELTQLLSAKGIPNYYDVWSTYYAHDWYTWKEMIVKHLDLLKSGVWLNGAETRLVGPQRRILTQKALSAS